MLEVKGISRFYGDQAAIEGISFCAEPGGLSPAAAALSRAFG